MFQILNFFIHLRIKYHLYWLGIDHYKINPNNSVDVFQYVYIDNLKLKKIPIQFNIIFGNFDCSYNKLSSLKGIPIKTEGTFYCDNNELCQSTQHLFSNNVCQQYISNELNLVCRKKIFLLNNII